MSSTTQSLGVLSSSAAPTPTATDTNTSPVEALTSSSSLLFGFLVSVLSLFALFMLCGIIWHRLVIRRRQIDARMSMYSRQEFQRPRIWDVWVLNGDQPQQWVDTKPLAAGTCDRTGDIPSKTVERSPDITFWRRHLLSRIPPEIIYLFNPPSPPSTPPHLSVGAPQTELPQHGTNVCVSVLIAMPHPPSSERQGKPEELHEMVIGSTDFIYHGPASS